MDDPLLLAIALTDDTVSIAVADADGAIIVQTAYPNDTAAGPDAFLSQLVEEAQVLLYPLPGQLRQIGLVAPQAGDVSGLSSRLSAAWGVPVWTGGTAQGAAERLLDLAIVLARRGLA